MLTRRTIISNRVVPRGRWLVPWPPFSKEARAVVRKKMHGG
jgi:hypothetical protein